MADSFVITAAKSDGTVEHWDAINASTYAVIVDILGPPKSDSGRGNIRVGLRWPERSIDRGNRSE